MPENHSKTDQDPSPAGSSETRKPDPTLQETIAPENSDTNAEIDGLGTDAIVSPLGRYEIKKLLGRGGMGAVYLAHDSQLDRDVALKVPKFDGQSNPKQIERFYREARSAANLSHPNLCQVFDVGEAEGKHYIAMAYIKGRPLSDYVRDGKQPATRVAAGIIRKVALAMHEAHDSGIIHRDLKPANIMVDHRNEPIVMDFGLAVAHENDDESRLTQEGSLLGSPAYMPPEQLQGELDALSPSSDVYSLGVVLYELLTGRLPFDGSGSTIAMIGQILTKQPKPLAEARPDVEPTLVQICGKAMARDASIRYSTMKAFASDLTTFIKSKPGDATKLPTEPSPKDTTKTQQTTKQITLAQVQLNEKAKLAKSLCDSGEFAAAIPLLKQILSTEGAQTTKEFAYAKSALPKAEQANATASAPATNPAPAADPFASLPAAAVPGTTGTPAYMQTPPTSSKAGKRKQGVSGSVLTIAGIALAGLIAVGTCVAMFQSDNDSDSDSDSDSASAKTQSSTTETVDSAPAAVAITGVFVQSCRNQLNESQHSQRVEIESA